MSTVDPVNIVLEHGQTVRMMHEETVGHDLCSPVAVVIARLDVVQVSVGEVDALAVQVQRETVGPVDLGCDDRGSVGAVQVGALDAREATPITPEDKAAACARINN